MKKLLLLISIFCVSSLSAQDVIVGLKGLVHADGVQVYEWAGYSITVEKEIDIPQNEIDFGAVKALYGIKNPRKVTYPTEEVGLSLIIEEEDTIRGERDILLHDILYFVKRADGKSDLLCFHKMGDRDLSIENKVVELFQDRRLSNYLLPSKVKSFDFLGRTIYLESDCEWQSPNSLDCTGGVLTWSIFDSYEKAEAESENRILRDRLYVDNVIVRDDDIPVVFENELVFGRRIVYRSKSNPQDNPFIVYYLRTGVREQFVSCALAYYGADENDYDLPELLTKVMQLEEIPEDESAKKAELEAIETKYNTPFFSLKAGIYSPIGKQKDILGDSFFFDLGFNFYIRENLVSSSALTFNLGLVIPSERQPFEYSEDGWVYWTHASLLINGNIGYLYTRKINRNLYWSVFGKLGFCSIGTDIYNGTNEDGNDKYKHVGVFSMGFGAQIRYQRLLFFSEYQHASFESNKHLNVGGTSALMFGIGLGL